MLLIGNSSSPSLAKPTFAVKSGKLCDLCTGLQVDLVNLDTMDSRATFLSSALFLLFHFSWRANLYNCGSQ